MNLINYHNFFKKNCKNLNIDNYLKYKFDQKVIKKSIKLIKLLLSVKLIFKSPKKTNLVIFDDVSSKDLRKYLLKNQKIFILKNRFQRIDRIYLSIKIIIKFFINLKLILKPNFFLQDIYFLSVIEFLEPKLVLTFIDNSLQFSKLCKVNKSEKINFLAIQNGTRLEWREQDFLFKKKLIKKNLNLSYSLSHFLSFGEFENDELKKYGINIKKITYVGSIRLANFLKDLYLKKINISKHKFDICLVSDYGAWINKYYGLNINDFTKAEEGMIKLIKFTIKFCVEKKLKFILSFKRKYKTEGYLEEQSWYKKILTKEEYNYILNNSNYKNEDTSYKCCFESKVVLGNMSALLRENLAFGNKILSCNFTKKNLYDFPIEGICKLKNCNYDEFCKRLIYIIKINKKTYFSKITKRKNYLVEHYDFNKCFKTINNNIKIYL